MPHADDNDDVNENAIAEREIGRDAATPGSRKTARSGKGNGGGSVNKRLGMGFLDDGEVLPMEAELAWPEILAKLPEKDLSPYDIRIEVVQLEPPSPNGQPMSLGGYINGGSVQGSGEEPPGMALVRYVTEYYHLPRAASMNAVTYQLRFSTTKKSIARAQLTLNGRAEILALRRADNIRRAAEVEQPPPYMPPPMVQPMQTPDAVAAARLAGVGAPPTMSPMMPQQQQPSVMETWQLAQQMASMMNQGGQMPQQMMDLLYQSLQQRMQPPVGVAAPPQPVINEDAIVEKTTTAVVATLAKLGVIKMPSAADQLQPTGVAAPAAVVVSPKSAMERAFDRVVEAAVGQFVGGIEKTIKQSITGFGAPPTVEETPAEETPKEPEIPWKTLPVPGVNWPSGAPVNYAEDSKTGDISLQGIVFANPVIMEKGFDIVTGLAGAATDLLKRAAAPKQMPPGVGAPKQMTSTEQTTIDAPSAVDTNSEWK